MALYRVHFKWKDKEYQLTAKSLDLTHPYFVSIKDLVFSREKKLIIDPSEDDTRKAFSQTNHIMIPLQAVSMIEEIETEGVSRVMPFDVVEDGDLKEENPKDEDSPQNNSQ
jgi:hypothetical protein